MDHVLIRKASKEDLGLMQEWLSTAIDGELFDADVLKHESTFVLMAFDRSGPLAFLPVQQPLMMESLAYRPHATLCERAQAITRLAEHVVEEAYARDAGEVYFLSRDKSTLKFAEHHMFAPLPENLQVRRLNLVEAFGEI